MAICYLGFGSNLGDRRKYITLALKKLALLKDTEIIKQSRFIETKPVGGPPGQRRYINAVVRLKTWLSPQSLFTALRKIERDLGRVRVVRSGPRTIDIDILFFDQKIIRTNSLTVPHPRMFERTFVLTPLLEVL